MRTMQMRPMRKTTRISISLITVLAAFGVHEQAFAQSNKISSTPKSSARAKLILPTDSVFIEDVRFEGLHVIEESRVALEFDQQHTGLTKNAPFEAANAQEGANIITRMLSHEAFMNANVEVRVEDISAKSKRITFVVDEGPPAVIREIRFEGNRYITDDDLRSHLESVSEMSHDVFDRARLVSDLIKLSGFMRSRGYLDARITEPKLHSFNGNLTIILNIKEGRLYYVGEITVTGAKRFSSDQIVELTGVKRGDIADGRIFNGIVDRDLDNLYRNVGYPKFSFEVVSKVRINPNDAEVGIEDYHIIVSEGSYYRIGAIEFLGNTILTTQALRRFLLFKEGDTYSQDLIHKSFQALRESRLVNAFGLEANAVYRFDEETGLVDVIIKVQEL